MPLPPPKNSMKDLIRILHVIPDMTLGGAQQIMADVALRIDPGKFKVAVVSMFPPAGRPLESELERAGIQISYLGKRVGFDPRMLLRLDHAMRRFNPDIVHTQCYALLYLIPLVLVRRTPVVVHTVQNVAKEDAYGVPWLVRWGFRRGVRPVAVCEEVARSVRQLHRLADCPVIFNGVDVQKCRRGADARERCRKDLGMDAGSIVFVNVGRISAQKNYGMLLKCFARVAEKVPDSHLVIAGSGELEPELRQQVMAMDARRNVHVLGARDDIPDLLAASDVYVLTSAWEGNPLSVMEAMSAGKAVVCTAVGGVPELVQDGVTGRLVPAGDAEAFTGAMLDLARDPGVRHRLGGHAAQEAERRFDVSVTVKSYADLYLHLLDSAKSGGSG